MSSSSYPPTPIYGVAPGSPGGLYDAPPRPFSRSSSMSGSYRDDDARSVASSEAGSIVSLSGMLHETPEERAERRSKMREEVRAQREARTLRLQQQKQQQKQQGQS